MSLFFFSAAEVVICPTSGQGLKPGTPKRLGSAPQRLAAG